MLDPQTRTDFNMKNPMDRTGPFIDPDEIGDKGSFKKLNATQFDQDFQEDHDGFLDQMLVLNKPCPVYEDQVYLFGRIRKSQEIRSRNTEEFNWNHLRQAGLHHALGGKVMPLRLSTDKWLSNATSDDQVLMKYGNYLNVSYRP